MSPVAPTFNSGQPLLSADVGPGSAQEVATASAFQFDGKLIVVGTTLPPGATASPGNAPSLTVRRYNTDGSLDATFGTGGQATIALNAAKSTIYSEVVPARDVVIDPFGDIVVAAALSNQQAAILSSPVGNVVGTAVVRLTGAGTPDPTFGSGGEVDFLAGAPDFNRLAVQGDGKIVLGGSSFATATAINPSPTIVATRLGLDGSVDTSFNGGNLVRLSEVATGTRLAAIDGLDALGVTQSGQVDLVYGAYPAVPGNEFASTYVIAGLNPDGSPSTNFGVNGYVRGASNSARLDAATVLPFGEVVVAAVDGTRNDTLIRYAADGTPEPFGITPNLPFRAQTLTGLQDGSVTAAAAVPVGSKSQVVVARYKPTGYSDVQFGPAGVAHLDIPGLDNVAQGSTAQLAATGVAVTLNGGIAVVGTQSAVQPPPNFFSTATTLASRSVVAILNPANPGLSASNDYDHDGRTDVAAELSGLAAFAYRASSGSGDVIQGFGAAGAGQTIPAPGDYDGDGVADVAAYLPAFGVLAYRPSSGGADQLIRFGPTGVGAAIPVPGDYDGDGTTDVALFLPATATFAIMPSSGAAPYAIQYGAAGVGQSIPTPADFEGTGRTDVAVYVPLLGQFFARANDPDVTFREDQLVFGPPGLGAAIPVPADYTGSGHAEFAVYIPSTGTFAVMNGSPTGANYAVQFGAAGAGQSIPLAGDYDGDGKADFAVYLPSLGAFADRPSGGGADVLQTFGTGGSTTVPAAATPGPTAAAAVTSAALTPDDPNRGLVFFLPEAADAKKKTT